MRRATIALLLWVANTQQSQADIYTAYVPVDGVVHIYIPRRAGFDPNCDNSWDGNHTPTLNAADFTCFLQKFAANELYADCDGSNKRPYCNEVDFTCFLRSFAAGAVAPILVTVGVAAHDPYRWNDYTEYEVNPIGGIVTFSWQWPCIVGIVAPDNGGNDCQSWEQITTLGFPTE